MLSLRVIGCMVPPPPKIGQASQADCEFHPAFVFADCMLFGQAVHVLVSV